MQSDNVTEPYLRDAVTVDLVPRVRHVHHLGFGRIVVSEIEVPNMLVNLV